MGLKVTFQLPPQTRKRHHDGWPSEPKEPKIGKVQKAPASLDRLSNPIASRICEFLRRKDLMCISVVSHRFYQLARKELVNILFERFFIPPEVVVYWPLSRMMEYSLKVDEIRHHIEKHYPVLSTVSAYSECFFFSKGRRLLVNPTLLNLICMDSPRIATIFSKDRVYTYCSTRDGSEYELTLLLNELFLIVGQPNLALRPLVPEKLKKELGLALKEACKVNAAGIMERIFAAGAKLDFGLLSTAVERHAIHAAHALLDHATHPNKAILTAQTLALLRNEIKFHEMISHRLFELERINNGACIK
ncbi:MAG TPA: hypothetical protein VMR37_02695 [Rhabdochlamydiaceae bacterium]|jgi:hypothetical protein|nr:hypothetical protein [Rhabdochlamydiaceae bacterium]